MTVDREAFLKANDPDAWMRNEPGPTPKITLWGPAPQPKPVDRRAQELEVLRQRARAALSRALGAYRENTGFELTNPIAKMRGAPKGAEMTITLQGLEGGAQKRTWTPADVERIESDYHGILDQQAAQIRSWAAQLLLGGAITNEQHSAVIRALNEAPATAAPAPIINVQPATVTPPDVTVNVRPVLDMSGDEEIVRDHAGKVLGKRRVARLEG